MVNTNWFWEGNVVSALARHLTETGWTIECVADTASGQPGPDIRASKEHRALIIEVKGYPSKVYERGTRKGQPKPTNPATQAKHWFAGALLTALRRQAADPFCHVALAFPDFPTYAKLALQIRNALGKLDLLVFVVGESGTVRTLGCASDSSR